MAVSAGDTGHVTAHNRLDAQQFNVKNYGALGDGSTDDTVAIQAAFTAQAAAADSDTDANGNTAGYVAPVYFPQGNYVMSATVNVSSSYGSVVGDKAILQKAAAFTGTAALSFAAPLWRGGVDGLQFMDFDTGIYVDTNNVNSGHVRISRCGFFSNTSYAIHLKVSSAAALIEDCMFRSNKHELYVETGDTVAWNGGWVQRGTLTDDYDGGIINYGILKMTNVLCVPKVQTVTEPAWIKNHASVSCVGVRFGGETGQHAAVNNYFEGTGNTGDPKDGVLLSHCEVYTGNDPVVRFFEIPNVTQIVNCRGFVGGTSTLIDWSATVDGAAQATKVAVVAPQGKTASHRISAYGNILEESIPANLEVFADIPSFRRIGDTTGGTLRFDRRDSTITSGEIYGQIEWYGHDASGSTSGVRAELRTEAIDALGATKTVVAATGPSSTALIDIVEVDFDGLTVLKDVGFYGTAPVAQQTGVAVSAAAIHAALVNLGLITA